MKIKCFLLSAAVVFGTVSAVAQHEDKIFFNHLSVGATIGTPGFGVDVAMPVCAYVQVRAGIAVFPKIKIHTDLDIDAPDVPGWSVDNIEVEAKTGFTNGKLLFDVYPFKRSSFYVTAGAYFGSSKIVEAYNREDGLLKPIADWNKTNPDSKYGVELGDYLLEPDKDGNVKAQIKTASFKPYLGIGFGRAVPRKRVGCMVELGCQFWGSPKLYCNDERLTEEKAGGDDGGVIKTLSKISVYPVLNFRICGRIF